jgi:probable rRNA maturation factor
VNEIGINNKTKSRLNLKVIREVAEKFLRINKINNKVLSIAFVGDKEMRRLNNKYRGKIGPTDILSFAGEDDFLGEIIMDCAQIKRQAKVFKNKTDDETYFILIHGLLHLSGYDDETEKGRKEMDKLGHKFFKKLVK